MKKVGRTLVKESGSSGTLLTFSCPNLSCPRSSPLSSLVGCKKTETLVPWKEVVAVVAVGSWSILSMADVMNNPFRQTGGHTTHPPRTC